MEPIEKKLIPADKLLLYDTLIATIPEIKRKGKANPYTSHNGHMFTFLSSTGVAAIRLPDNERELFLKKYDTRLMESYGVVLKEYVEVPADLLGKTTELKTYLELSYYYIQTLKPKTTKRKTD